RLTYQTLEISQIRRDGLGGMRKATVGLQVNRRHLAAQALQQGRYDHRTSAVDTVQGDMESALPDGRDVDVGKLQNQLEMPLRGTAVALHRAQAIPRRPRDAPLGDGPHVGAFVRLE